MIIIGTDHCGHHVPLEVQLDSINTELNHFGVAQDDTRIRVGENRCPHDFIGRGFANELELLALYNDAVEDHLQFCYDELGLGYESNDRMA